LPWSRGARGGASREPLTLRGAVRAGETWSKPATLIFTEEPNMYGKYWTWVHWELQVSIMDFFKATEVACRAWDMSQNTQPATLTWTLLGQGNNSIFRLKLHKEVDGQVRTGRAPCGHSVRRLHGSRAHVGTCVRTRSGACVL
jgi:Mo-co oxidoreductase dimerisation domain